LFKNFPELLNYNIYIKYGRYIEELKIDNNIQYGIKLASINQGIIKILKQPIDNF
jgi:hypothetical protein